MKLVKMKWLMKVGFEKMGKLWNVIQCNLVLGARLSTRVLIAQSSEMNRIAMEAKKLEKIRELEQEKKKEEEEKKRKREEDERNAEEAIRRATQALSSVSGKTIRNILLDHFIVVTSRNLVDLDSVFVQECRNNNLEFLNYFFSDIQPYLPRHTQPLQQKGLIAAIKAGSKDAFALLLQKGTNPEGSKDSVLQSFQLHFLTF